MYLSYIYAFVRRISPLYRPLIKKLEVSRLQLLEYSARIIFLARRFQLRQVRRPIAGKDLLLLPCIVLVNVRKVKTLFASD